MARKVNTSFGGVTERETDPGAWVNQTVIEDAVGDTALVHDMLTGDNSPSTTIDHTGGGAGVPLGVPCGASVVVLTDRGVGSAQQQVNSAWAGSFDNNGYLFVFPVYIPEGETGVSVTARVNDAEALKLEIRDTSWVAAGEATENVVDGSWWTGNATGLTEGTRYFVGVTCPLGPVEPVRTWSGVRVYFPGQGRPDMIEAMPEATNPDWPQVPVNSQSSSGANIIDQEDFDGALFTKNRAINAVLCDRLNKNQNALFEFMSGAPAGGNDEYTLTPTSEDDPASSAFHDHSLSTHTNEGEIDFPLLSVPLGAVQNASTSIDYLTDNWGAPAAQTFSSDIVLANDIVIMPDFPDTTSTSNLRCMVLGTFPNNASKASVTARVQAHWSGGSGTPRSQAFVQLGGDYYGAQLGTSGSRIDFAAGEANHLRITIYDASASVANALRIVGYAYWFDRDL